MNDEELAALEAQLRALIRDLQLEWVLEQVDDSISQGILEYKHIGQASIDQDDAIGPSWVGPGEPSSGGRSRRKRHAYVSYRPMTNQERVITLIESLRRVTIELPKISLQMLEGLNELDSAHQVEVVAFLDDGQSFEDAEMVLDNSAVVQMNLHVDELQGLLDELKSEVEGG